MTVAMWPRAALSLLQHPSALHSARKLRRTRRPRKGQAFSAPMPLTTATPRSGRQTADASEAIRPDHSQIRCVKALSKPEAADADVRIDDGKLLIFAIESQSTGSLTSWHEGGCRDNRADAACQTDGTDFAASGDEESDCLMVGWGPRPPSARHVTVPQRAGPAELAGAFAADQKPRGLAEARGRHGQHGKARVNCRFRVKATSPSRKPLEAMPNSRSSSSVDLGVWIWGKRERHILPKTTSSRLLATTAIICFVIA
ncbi:unnamed protein product [Symbiodinium sp. CCMP2456]|nr:unnamed protein product [Symbiodinium sp. CCMP2456]